jgi:hypothetical protein
MDEDCEEEDNHHHHQERWNGGKREDFPDDGRGYDRAARGFYTNDPPSANSAVIETVFRKPKLLADLNEYDDGVPTIDRVPTAIGYHSMDSAEEYNEEKSRASRYSFDVRDEHDVSEEGEEEIPPPIQQMPSPDPDDGDKYSQYLNEAPEFQDSTMRSRWSEDSDSCPPMWRSFSSEQEELGPDWALEQAKRRAALNAVTPPKEQRSEGHATPSQRTVRGPADDRSNRERQSDKKADGGSMRSSVRGSMRGSMRDKSRGSREDSTTADGNDSENHPRASNVQTQQRKSVSKKPGKKGWEAWGYLFKGGGSVKSKKSNDSSHESRSKSTKSKNSKSHGTRHTRGPGPKKNQPQSVKRVQPSEAKPVGEDDTTSQPQPVTKTRSSEAKPENDHSSTGRRVQKNQPRPTRKTQSNEAKSPNEDDATSSHQVQEVNDEKSRLTTETWENSESTTKDSKADGSLSQLSSSIPSRSEKETAKAPIKARRPNAEEGSSRKSSVVQQERTRPARAPLSAPPVPSISLPVKVPLKQPLNPVDNDEFIMQVRGEEPTLHSSPSLPPMDQTEPKEPNKFDGFATILMSGFGNLTNLGLNEPFSFLDWSGEEKEIEKLSNVASSDSKKKKKLTQIIDDEGTILLALTNNIKESESLTLDGSVQLPAKKVAEVEERHSQSGRSQSSRRSVDGRIRANDDVQVYEERRAGRGDRDSRSGGQLGSSRSESEDLRESRREKKSVHQSRSGSERGSQQLPRMRDVQGKDHMERYQSTSSAPKHQRRGVAASNCDATRQNQSNLSSSPAQPVRNGTGSRHSEENGEVQLPNYNGLKGTQQLRVHEETSPAFVRQPESQSGRERESQSGRDGISISTIEFPTPDLDIHEEDDGSISVLGLDRNRSHNRPSSVPLTHPEFDESKEVVDTRSKSETLDTRSKSETRSRHSGTDSKKSSANSKKSATKAKKGKSTFLGKFLARKKGQ